MRHARFVTIVLMLLAAPSAFAQAEAVILPDHVMRQVVSRIARWNFKPGRNLRTIPVADIAIKREWLPAIENITFELVPENDVSDHEKGVYFFQPVERDGAAYTINFGRGDLDCRANGETWKFKIRDNRVRLWRTGHGWGQGCGGSNPPRISGLKIGDISPNELPGYEFFAKGKLKGVRLGVSTREDMRRIFGDTCEGKCDYDQNWSVFVNYFGDETVMSRSSSEGEFELVPKPEFVGTLRFVTMIPKDCLPFSKVKFPRRFSHGLTHAVGDDWGPNGFEGATHSVSDTYTDGYGLRYTVYSKETFNNSRQKGGVLRKGDLVDIEYEIPEAVEEIIYIKVPKSRTLR